MTDLRVFIVEGPGHYLGAAYVVLARDTDQAIQIAREQAVSDGLVRWANAATPTGTHGLTVREIEASEPCVLYADDEDY